MIISSFLVTLMYDVGGYCKEKLDGSHSYGSKGSNLMWTLFILSLMETSNNCVGGMDS